MTDDAVPTPFPFDVRAPRANADPDEGHPLVFDGLVIGELRAAPEDGSGRPAVILNLGWARSAGVRVIVEADPQVDRKRGGVVLDR